MIKIITLPHVISNLDGFFFSGTQMKKYIEFKLFIEHLKQVCFEKSLLFAFSIVLFFVGQGWPTLKDF